MSKEIVPPVEFTYPEQIVLQISKSRIYRMFLWTALWCVFSFGLFLSREQLIILGREDFIIILLSSGVIFILPFLFEIFLRRVDSKTIEISDNRIIYDSNYLVHYYKDKKLSAISLDRFEFSTSTTSAGHAIYTLSSANCQDIQFTTHLCNINILLVDILKQDLPFDS